jgi:alkanesulfonate monooxygenase SsuD/methylene tetrahydromethanopterin reductase-like flavin-dependent oxidoreductase (luciferase family)
MCLGAVVPQTAIGADPVAVHDLALAAEDPGYDYQLASDHVILPAAGGYVSSGAGVATSAVPIHEPLVLFGYPAGSTRAIELVTGVLVWLQRQTVLVAKQAAEVDVSSGGRLRLGVGVD